MAARVFDWDETAAVPEGAVVAEVWSFAPAGARAAAEARLAARGVRAVVRPALKPALAAFRGLPVEAGDRVEVEVPGAPGPSPDRFAAELFPLADLLGVPVEVRVEGVAEGPALCRARVWRGEAAVAEAEALVPVRLRGAAWAACGWVRAEFPDGRVEAGPWEDPCEAALFAALEAVRGLGRRDFGRLTLRIEGAFEDEALGVGEEAVSLAEVLHEELYFGALEILKAARGAAPGDRTVAPGQVAPEIVPAAGPVRLTVRVGEPRGVSAVARRAPDWGEVERAPRAAELLAGMAALGGRPMAAVSRQGRRVEGRVLAGRGPAVLLTGGQHANEPTGPVGVLTAARRLAAEGAALGVCALENPDGYAMYEDLLRVWPRHMHHAARYTAAGCDLAYRGGWEGELRRRLGAETGAELHLSLHGYPSHEWLRPFAGYVPEGFGDWRLPRGMFLILRTAAGWEERGEAVLRAAAGALGAMPEVVALTRAQLGRLRRHAPGVEVAMLGEIPVLRQPAGAGTVAPVTIITEAPDETVEGPVFRLLAAAQAEAAVAAARAWREIG
mgnify:CR=1 FL=1